MAAKIVFTAHTNLIQFSSFAIFQRDGQKALPATATGRQDRRVAELAKRQIDGANGLETETVGFQRNCFHYKI